MDSKQHTAPPQIPFKQNGKCAETEVIIAFYCSETLSASADTPLELPRDTHIVTDRPGAIR